MADQPALKVRHNVDCVRGALAALRDAKLALDAQIADWKESCNHLDVGGSPAMVPVRRRTLSPTPSAWTDVPGESSCLGCGQVLD